MIPSTEKHTKPDTERILQLADAYADVPPSQHCGHQRFALENAIERIIAERDTLAAGVSDLVGCCAVRLDGIHVIQAAIAVAERLKAASEPAKPEGDHGGKPSPLAAKMATMQEEVGGILKHGGMSYTGELIAAIHAVARVVEELAKETK